MNPISLSPSVRRRACGFTLIEIVVASGVMAIVIALAATAASSQIRAQRASERTGSMELQTAVAAAILDRNLSNAGLMFPDARYAIHIYNNVAADLPNGDGTTVPAIGVSDTGAGVILGTDVVEAIIGDPIRRGIGTVVSSTGANPVLNSYNPFISLGPPTPSEVDLLTASALLNPNPLILFSNGTGTSCAALATKMQATPPTNTLTVQYYGRNLDFNSPIGAPASCPQAGMSAYAAGTAPLSRIRFMVYKQATGQVPGLGLYMQVVKSATALNNAPVFDPAAITIVEAGIEDMQVRAGVVDTTLALCGTPQCWCNDGTGTCTYDINSSSDALLSSLSLLTIRLTSRGVTETKDLQDAFRPASYDHPAGPVDNILRWTNEFPVMLPNVSLGSI